MHGPRSAENATLLNFTWKYESRGNIANNIGKFHPDGERGEEFLLNDFFYFIIGSGAEEIQDGVNSVQMNMRIFSLCFFEFLKFNRIEPALQNK